MKFWAILCLVLFFICGASDFAAGVPILASNSTDSLISINNSSLNAIPDSNGRVVVLGTLINNGYSFAVSVKVTVMLYDPHNNYIGSASSFARGGQNVKLDSSGEFTNALGFGDTGFFKIETGFQYLIVGKIIYSIGYETLPVTTSHAVVNFLGDPVLSSADGKLIIYGEVFNSSSSYLAYLAKAVFAVFDSSNKMIDLGETFIDGYEFDYGSGVTNYALYPNENGTFSASFSVSSSEASSFLGSFEWKEVQTTLKPEKYPPFGAFETPTGVSPVSGSVPVTGWALDDKEVESVKIYRDTGDEMVFVGDAQFVEGARPDIAAAYPDYPNNTRAGWGYMLLTNILPYGGNGRFTLFAEAKDKSGKTTLLGPNFIICDNAHAVKPFGAIDTPTQGGAASGKEFINWGWALTPQPNVIPIDGSSIRIFVDSKYIGRPVYNLYRSDIATMFPGYANSTGAIGYYFLNTKNFSNGVHTIYWVAKNSGGNEDGIGSRYFTVKNAATSMDALRDSRMEINKYAPIIPQNFESIRVKKGFNDDGEAVEIFPGEPGFFHIEVNPLERVEIKLSDTSSNGFDGFQVIENRFALLPVGSTLDSKEGIFHWAPAQGFLGRFHLVFIEKMESPDAYGPVNKKDVIIDIVRRYE